MGSVCNFCGKEVDLPYQCPYCGLFYCEDHRLPEQHNCLKAPNRDWDTFRELKNIREGYGWLPLRKKGENEEIYEHRRIMYESETDFLEPIPINGLEPKKKFDQTSDKKCKICDTKSPLYVCDYCGKLYCGDHIDPDKHNCDRIISTSTGFRRTSDEPKKNTSPRKIEAEQPRLRIIFLFIGLGLIGIFYYLYPSQFHELFDELVQFLKSFL
jgi:predicted nucleic acid binding AN1-type Zn finger protein